MLTDVAVIAAALAVAAFLVWPRIAQAPGWRATVTPLASIIGSGFLVLGPILDDSFGVWAPVAMAGLCAVAWAFGAAIRVNIADLDAHPQARGRAERQVETAASWVLAAAYVISVTYYLNLFGAFALRIADLGAGAATRGGTGAQIVTTLVFLGILALGAGRGFGALERAEQVSVGLKLAIIAGLLAGLVIAFGGRAAENVLVVNPVTVSGWPAVWLVFGLIVTVQGFETSRYLGASYDAALRIRTMRRAQALSAAIYVAYVTPLVFLFPAGAVPFSETAIVGMMGQVAPVLPPLLILAALSAQLSAAIADTGGSGGLVAELTGGRVSERMGYAGLVALGIGMTWMLDVFQIIAYASRAFALYYALQAGLAAMARHRAGRADAPLYAGLAVLGLLMAALGAPVEG